MYTYEDVCFKIEEIGHKLISKEYKSTKIPLVIECKCGVIYEKRFDSFIKGYYHCNGKKQISKKRPIEKRNCLQCGIEFKPITNRNAKYCNKECSKKIGMNSSNLKRHKERIEKNRKECIICKKYFISKQGSILCSFECSVELQRTDFYKERAKIFGSKGGKASAKAQQKRSKNEVYFSELCERWFGRDDVRTNETMFDGWDADVIILSKKIAVLWNGVWHYKQISKSQSLKQVQTRDEIKTKIIEKQGYIPYVICDMGKYNPSFVEREFEIFLFSIITV